MHKRELAHMIICVSWMNQNSPQFYRIYLVCCHHKGKKMYNSRLDYLWYLDLWNMKHHSYCLCWSWIWWRMSNAIRRASTGTEAAKGRQEKLGASWWVGQEHRWERVRRRLESWMPSLPQSLLVKKPPEIPAGNQGVDLE